MTIVLAILCFIVGFCVGTIISGLNYERGYRDGQK